MLDISHVLALLRRDRPGGREACPLCGRRLGETRLVVRGLRVHPECAGYRSRAGARRERAAAPGVPIRGD